MIELETKNNIAHIQGFWRAVLSSKEVWSTEDGEFLYAQLADQASGVPFPRIATDGWRANLGEVTSVYTERELESMWQLQRDLERVQLLHEFFCEAQSERRKSTRFVQEQSGYGLIGAFASGAHFAEAVKEPAREFKDLIESLINFEVVNA